MARKYTSKETKLTIDKHKRNIKRLESSVDLKVKYKKQIQSYVNEMLSDGAFSSIVMASLRDEDLGGKDQLEEVNRLLYLYKRAKQQYDKCQFILRNNKERIESMIRDASVGSNTVIWIFASSKKKQNFEAAYEKLDGEIGESEYWKASNEVLSSIDRNDFITAEEAWNDYKSDTERYRDREILKSILPPSLKSSELVDDLADLIKKFEDIALKLEKETSKTDAIKADIKTAAQRMATVAALDVLKTVPVEEINRGKKGIRVKALRDAGYNTMADLYCVTPYQLASIYGISEDAAYTINDISNEFAVEAIKNAKIKLSVDNKTKEATKLVSELFRYRQYAKALEMLNRLNNDYEQNIKTSISNLQSVESGVYWCFFSDNKKADTKESYSYLNREIQGEYSSRAIEVIEMFKGVSKPVAANAWTDFENNSILYFNILEEIVPEMLGNDDQLYGLPENLAREIQEESFFPDGLKCTLRSYQMWGVKYILHQERVLLGDEMGLGKTIQAIAAMVSLRNTGATHFVVVCPASVLVNWCNEIRDKSKLLVTIVHGPGRTSAIKSWMDTGGVAVTTYETTGIFNFDEAFTFDLLVVDEAHYIKNANAVRSKNVRNLATYTKRMLFMTGTALENNVDEMISLINILQPNVAQSIRGITFMSSAPQFREKIAGVYYRRKRENVLKELPDLIESREWCTMWGEEARIYEEDVLAKDFMKVRRLSWNVDDLDHSCKARRMMEIINEAESEKRKVIIFSFFLDTIRKIHNYLGKRCCNPINGSLTPNRRQEIISEFQNSPEKTVLCAQIQSGGTGLNIQAASVVIICEPQFKPSIENQAISRAYRMGQARNVLVYRLLCENTVDERITDILEYKQEVFDAFADRSVAAESTMQPEKEIDEASFGKIIEEEIERITAKNDEPNLNRRNASMYKNVEPKKKSPAKREVTDEPGFVSGSALTSSAEYADELDMDYYQLVEHLLKKYGKAKGDYFLTETCATKNKKVSRTSEGLFCHHIDEDKAINLSQDIYAIDNPFDYQRAERLVYCNIIEHLILHIKIFETTKDKCAAGGEPFGIRGALCFIIKQINDYYGGCNSGEKYLITAMSFIKDNFDDYIKILRYLWGIIRNDNSLSSVIGKKQLAIGWSGNVVNRVYDLI